MFRGPDPEDIVPRFRYFITVYTEHFTISKENRYLDLLNFVSAVFLAQEPSFQ
jgi:hypothetical protein